MTKKIVVISVVLGLMAAGSVLATPSFPVAQLSTPGVQKTLILPPAAAHSPVISLGPAVDPGSGKIVEGYAIIHYKKGYGKPPWAGGGKGKGETKCYGFLAKGAKWRTVEQWIVNPANIRGLDENFILNNLTADIDKWENAASANILGIGSSTFDILLADIVSPDNKNEVYFADIESSGAIAVTIIWGIFGGPPSQRELVEWDQVYDDVDYDWSSSGEAGKMDFENIATHELGHSVGLDDLYDSNCSEETMYGYADYGEINKQDLNAGDIIGISKLY
ncbi:MAG: matrixin family metalloprotease [Candidatus Paceibacterota bacterium]